MICLGILFGRSSRKSLLHQAKICRKLDDSFVSKGDSHRLALLRSSVTLSDRQTSS